MTTKPTKPTKPKVITFFTVVGYSSIKGCKKILGFMLVAVSVLTAEIYPPLEIGECQYTEARLDLSMIWEYAGRNDIMFACRDRDNIYYEVAFDKKLNHIVQGKKHAGDAGYSVAYLDRYFATAYFYDEFGVQVQTVQTKSSIEMVQRFYIDVKNYFNMKPKTK